MRAAWRIAAAVLACLCLGQARTPADEFKFGDVSSEAAGEDRYLCMKKEGIISTRTPLLARGVRRPLRTGLIGVGV
jgi:hypothetical protein